MKDSSFANLKANTGAIIFVFYIFSENLILANTAKFDLALPLPGSLWNNYFLWSKSLETNFPDDECGGFCYFHDPDPSECSFAVADVSDPSNRICYMGSFLLESGGLETGKGPFIEDISSYFISLTLASYFY